MAKRDEVDPADESGATEPSETADERTGSSTGEAAGRPPADSTDEEFDEIVRNSGVDVSDADRPSEDADDAEVLEPAGVAATSARSGSTARASVPARAPKAAPTARRDGPPAKPERTTPLKFVRQSVGELRKVVYPTGQQLINYFIVVLVFVLFVIAYVSVLDLGFGALIFRIFS